MKNSMISCVPTRKGPMLGKLIMTAIIVLAISFPSGMLMADSRWTPVLNLTATSDDNVNFVHTDSTTTSTDDYIYQVAPGIKYDYDQEVTKFFIDGLVEVRKYQDSEELDDETYFLSLKGLTNITERFALNGRYLFTKDTTLDSELEEIGRIFTREDRYSHFGSIRPTFKLTERATIGLSSNYRNVSYDSDVDVDYTRWEVGIPVWWRLVTQVDRIFFHPSYSEFDSDTNRSTSYNFRMGWSHETTERLNVNLSVGARYTEHENKVTKATEDNLNGLGALKLTYKYETGETSLDFEHDLQNTASGEQVNVSRVKCRLKYYFTERMGLGFDGRYYYTQTEGETNDATTEYIQVGPDLFYNLTENHVVFIAYEYSQENLLDLTPDQEQDPNFDSRAERNKIWAGIRLSFPM